MKSIREEIASASLNPEYAYIKKNPPFSERFTKKIFEIYCKILFTVYCPLTVKGKENIPSSSFIFCSNHNSHMDSGILMVASGKPFKDFAMMAAKDYFFDNVKRKNFLNTLMNLIPINRHSSMKEMVDFLVACKEFLKDDNRVLIFYPEGTRSLTGKMGSFKKGPAMTSVELNVPIVPGYIKGTFDAWPKGKIFMKPTRIHVNIGEPIYPDKFLNGSCESSKSFEAYNKITSELEQRIYKLTEI